MSGKSYEVIELSSDDEDPIDVPPEQPPRASCSFNGSLSSPSKNKIDSYFRPINTNQVGTTSLNSVEQQAIAQNVLPSKSEKTPLEKEEDDIKAFIEQNRDELSNYYINTLKKKFKVTVAIGVKSLLAEATNETTAQELMNKVFCLTKVAYDAENTRRNDSVRKYPSKNYSHNNTKVPFYNEEEEIRVLRMQSGKHVDSSLDPKSINNKRDQVIRQEPEPNGPLRIIITPIGHHLYKNIMSESHSIVETMTASYKPSHECSKSCGVIIDANKHRGVPSLMVPLLYKFNRLCLKSNDPFRSQQGPSKKMINYIYVAPCGAKLRSLDEVKMFIRRTESNIDIDYFTMEDVSLYLPSQIFRSILCFSHQSDLSDGKESQPISVLNYIDDEVLTNYEYIKDRIVNHEELETSEGDFTSCCDCEDNCADESKCSCIQLTQKGYETVPKLGKLYRTQYNLPLGYEHKRLADHPPFGIYECNKNCKCNSLCPNRVVQNGIKVQLEIFKTQQKGWGVRCKQDIPVGSFITTYSAPLFLETSEGTDMYFANLDFIECAENTKQVYEEAPLEEISDDESDSDESDESAHELIQEDFISTLNRNNSYYKEKAYIPKIKVQDKQLRRTFTRASKDAARNRIRRINLCYGSPERDRDRDNNQGRRGTAASKHSSLRTFFPNPEPFVLDAQITGNVGRFLNHSCEPNCFVASVFIETHDPRLPHVSLFAKRNIKALEELTWDYQYEVGSVKGRRLWCYCASEKCRGRLL